MAVGLCGSGNGIGSSLFCASGHSDVQGVSICCCRIDVGVRGLFVLLMNGRGCGGTCGGVTVVVPCMGDLVVLAFVARVFCCLAGLGHGGGVVVGVGDGDCRKDEEDSVLGCV